jgi:sugar lactone lactonase YvrE
MDKDGNIYILDSGNARIQKFGPDGKYLATIGGKGQGPGELMLPDGIDFDRDGNLIVADSAQSRIKVVIGDGKDVKSVVLKDQPIRGIRTLSSGKYATSAATFLDPRNIKRPSDVRLFRILAPDGRTITGSAG